MAFPGTKHGTRRRPYRVRWGKGVETVNAAEWNRAIADRWIVPVTLDDGSLSDRIARLADGVKATLCDGVLHLHDLHKKADVWIYTSWKAIDRRAPLIRGEYFVREVRRQYAPVAPNPDADIVNRWGTLEGPGGVPVTI